MRLFFFFFKEKSPHTHTIRSHLISIPSHPIPSNPTTPLHISSLSYHTIHSYPIPSHPIPSHYYSIPTPPHSPPSPLPHRPRKCCNSQQRRPRQLSGQLLLLLPLLYPAHKLPLTRPLPPVLRCPAHPPSVLANPSSKIPQLLILRGRQQGQGRREVVLLGQGWGLGEGVQSSRRLCSRI